jgi:hypothetical protein
MPVYIYQHPKTKEVIEIIQSIHDKHEYIDDKNIKWNRIFTIPEVNTQGVLKAECSPKEFAEYTKNKKGTIGDLWDRSSELSEKRKKIYGKDPIKEKYFKDWSKKRKGKIHPKSNID